MKKIYFLLLCANLFLGASVYSASDIKLGGKKGHVLAIPVRTTVLDVAEEYLKTGNSDFMAQLESVESPYGAEEEAVVVTEAPVAAEEQAPEAVAAPIHYDDASVLKGIGATFAKQVRGTLEKGGRSYLQLQGGGLLKSGTSFPAKIPEVKDKTFTVTVSDVTSRGYTLSMGESTLPVSFNGSTGATKDTRE